MEPTPQASLSAQASSSKLFLSSSVVPYLVAALLASGAMAWYFFVFVPAQLEYFAGLRFRTLAVASGQVRSKIENLQRALEGAFKGVLEAGASDAPLTASQDLLTLGTIAPADNFRNRSLRNAISTVSGKSGAGVAASA